MASPRRRKNLFMLVPNGDMISVGNGCTFGQVYYIHKCPPTCSSSYMIHLKKSITATVVDLCHIRFNSSYDLNIPSSSTEFSMTIVTTLADKLCHQYTCCTHKIIEIRFVSGWGQTKLLWSYHKLVDIMYKIYIFNNYILNF